ncbi:hypothetical protein [Salinithrix halophila]|uniref:ABC-2 type transport system permease protein n=1 Tax=Salinithrix halophila TaxID=1485204 RepID=A0ABV8JFT6_9BACL
MNRLLPFHLCTIWTQRHLLLMTAFFIGFALLNLLHFYSENQVTLGPDAMTRLLPFTFGGPGIGNYLLLDWIRWILPYGILHLIIGPTPYEGRTGSFTMYLLRARSGRRWWQAKTLALSLSCAFFFLTGDVLLILIASIMDPSAFSLSQAMMVTLGQLFLLQWSTSWAWTLIHSLLPPQKFVYGYLLILVVFLLSLLPSADWAPWLPGNQGIWMRHGIHHALAIPFDWLWSLTYNALLTGIAFLIGLQRFSVMDLTQHLKEA